MLLDSIAREAVAAAAAEGLELTRIIAISDDCLELIYSNGSVDVVHHGQIARREAQAGDAPPSIPFTTALDRPIDLSRVRIWADQARAIALRTGGRFIDRVACRLSDNEYWRARGIRLDSDRHQLCWMRVNGRPRLVWTIKIRDRPCLLVDAISGKFVNPTRRLYVAGLVAFGVVGTATAFIAPRGQSVLFAKWVFFAFVCAVCLAIWGVGAYIRWLKERSAMGVIFLLLIMLGTLALYITPYLGEQVCWAGGAAFPGDGTYQFYLDHWPNGRHREAALKRCDVCAFRWASSSGLSGSFRDYLSMHPRGAFVQAASRQLEELLWVEAAEKDSIDAYSTYLDRSRPDDPHRAKAAARLHELQNVDRVIEEKWQVEERRAYSMIEGSLSRLGRLPKERRGKTLVFVLDSGFNDPMGHGQAVLRVLKQYWNGPVNEVSVPAFIGPDALVKLLSSVIERQLADPSARLIVNMSWETGYDPLAEVLFSELSHDGILFVAASGNDGKRNGCGYPSAYPGVVAVAAVQSAAPGKFHLTDYTNYGPCVTFCAVDPMQDFKAFLSLLEIDPAEADGLRTKFQSGTSFAAPRIAGMLAGLNERKPGIPPAELIDILQGSARAWVGSCPVVVDVPRLVAPRPLAVLGHPRTLAGYRSSHPSYIAGHRPGRPRSLQ